MILVAKTSDLGAYMRHTGYSKKKKQTYFDIQKMGPAFWKVSRPQMFNIGYSCCSWLTGKKNSNNSYL